MAQCVNGANTSSFVYGADGIRRQSTVNGATTDFVLDNSMFVRERKHATGASIATYFAGARGPEYRRDDVTGVVRWYLYDGLGSVLGEVDPNGNITSSRKYDAYGLVRGGNNPAGTSSHKFVGQLGHPSEDNTGFIYMLARYMDPVTGRFIGEDTGRQSANWYSYCGNNPINRFDKTGKNWIWDVVFTGFLLLLRAALLALELPILAAICFIVAAICFLCAIIEPLIMAYEDKDEIENRQLKQRSSGLTTIGDAIITNLKQKGGMSAVLGWNVELVFGIMEIDAL